MTVETPNLRPTETLASAPPDEDLSLWKAGPTTSSRKCQYGSLPQPESPCQPEAWPGVAEERMGQYLNQGHRR